MAFDFKAFGKKCIRVWHVLKKPQKDEFLMVAKVSAIGILAIGLMGFIISLIVREIAPKTQHVRQGTYVYFLYKNKFIERLINPLS